MKYKEAVCCLIEKDDAETLEKIVGAEIAEIFNKEIVRELLLISEPNTDDALVDKMWGMCRGNPFDAKILYDIIQIVECEKLE